jgi:hypothetical protein
MVNVDISYYLSVIRRIMKFDIFKRKKFKCSKCEENFKNETELNKHQQITHEGGNADNKK